MYRRDFGVPNGVGTFVHDQKGPRPLGGGDFERAQKRGSRWVRDVRAGRVWAWRRKTDESVERERRACGGGGRFGRARWGEAWWRGVIQPPTPLFAQRSGHVLTLRSARRKRWSWMVIESAKGEIAVVVDGFNVYAGDAIDGRDRKRV